MLKSKQPTTKFLHVITIVHGESELTICEHIASNLRIKHKDIGEQLGKSSIQINKLMKFLNSDSRFNTETGFKRTFTDIEKDEKKLIKFKIFIIMDTDDCDEQTKQNYKTGLMFKGHFLEPYIVPIYNEPNLESTMASIGIIIKDKKEYKKIFPVNSKGINLEKIKFFSDKLRKSPNTNMEVYVDYCIKIAESELINPNRNKLRR